MKKYIALTLAASVVAAAHAQVQTTTEKTTVRTESRPVEPVQKTTEIRTETHAVEPVQKTTEVRTETVAPATITRLESAYRYAGIPQADIVRLNEIDRKVIEARRVNSHIDLNPYYVEQTRILQPTQLTKVRTYLKEHPVATEVPAYEVTTYETVPTKAGVEVNTPIGSIGVGVPTGTKVIEHKEVVQ